MYNGDSVILGQLSSCRLTCWSTGKGWVMRLPSDFQLYASDSSRESQHVASSSLLNSRLNTLLSNMDKEAWHVFFGMSR